MDVRWYVGLFLFVFSHYALAECRDYRIPGIPNDAARYVSGADTTYWHVFTLRDSGNIDVAGPKQWTLIGQIDRIYRRGLPEQAYVSMTLVVDTSIGKDVSAVVMHVGGNSDTVLSFGRDENMAPTPVEERTSFDRNHHVRLYSFMFEITPDFERIRTGLRHMTFVFDNGRSITSHNAHPEQLQALMLAAPSPRQLVPDTTPRTHAPGHSLL